MSDRKKILGCWLGKAAGGTLGQPYEGCEGPLALTFYDPVPTDMIPNDDLDLQVLWACVLAKMENPVINREIFARAWLEHVEFCYDEYGFAIRNLHHGVMPPHSGVCDNWFKDGLGAAIRSEIWACLAPGNPELAARYAREDACVDHTGDGIYAAQFLAAAESMAFIENDLIKIINAGLSVIPADSRLARAIRDTVKWCEECTDSLIVRSRILDKWGSENFTDAVMNLPFALLGLLHGKGDFGATVCIACNCGKDADCTAATAGALYGIINPDGIPEKWLAYIGDRLLVSKEIVGITPPETLGELCDMIMAIADKKPMLQAPETLPFHWPDTLKLQAECAIFSPWFAADENRFSPCLPDNFIIREFNGFHNSINADEVPLNSLYMMRFRFAIPERKNVIVMFNSPENTRVWIDGEYAFGREGGRMAPSFHRYPLNQSKKLTLAAGVHELLVGIAPITGKDKLEWVIGVADAATRLWLTDIKWNVKK
jgi:ADP-ribosylglycohydrolase